MPQARRTRSVALSVRNTASQQTRASSPRTPPVGRRTVPTPSTSKVRSLLARRTKVSTSTSGRLIFPIYTRNIIWTMCYLMVVFVGVSASDPASKYMNMYPIHISLFKLLRMTKDASSGPRVRL